LAADRVTGLATVDRVPAWSARTDRAIGPDAMGGFLALRSGSDTVPLDLEVTRLALAGTAAESGRIWMLRLSDAPVSWRHLCAVWMARFGLTASECKVGLGPARTRRRGIDRGDAADFRQHRALTPEKPVRQGRRTQPGFARPGAVAAAAPGRLSVIRQKVGSVMSTCATATVSSAAAPSKYRGILVISFLRDRAQPDAPFRRRHRRCIRNAARVDHCTNRSHTAESGSGIAVIGTATIQAGSISGNWPLAVACKTDRISRPSLLLDAEAGDIPAAMNDASSG